VKIGCSDVRCFAASPGHSWARSDETVSPWNERRDISKSIFIYSPKLTGYWTEVTGIARLFLGKLLENAQIAFPPGLVEGGTIG